VAKSIYVVFGGPTTPVHEEELNRWYEQHLEQMCSLPGITAAHLYRPSGDQLPRTKAKLPQTLGIYEYDTVDHAGAAEALAAAHSEGAKRGAYEAGVSIPGPPDSSFTVDSQYQSAYYNLVSRFPRDSRERWDLTSKTIFMVFGGPTKPALEEEVMRWYIDVHLDEICSLPGIVSGQFFRPSIAQLADTTVKLPEVLGLYEYETDDLAGAIDGLFAAHLQGMKSGVYEPGLSIPGPAEGIWALNPQHQSAYYELVSRWSREDA